MAKVTITITDDNLVNLTQAARELDISYMTMWRWIQKGKVKPIRIAGLPYLYRQQVEVLKK